MQDAIAGVDQTSWVAFTKSLTVGFEPAAEILDHDDIAVGGQFAEGYGRAIVCCLAASVSNVLIQI